jgi:hypothetical protein
MLGHFASRSYSRAGRLYRYALMDLYRVINQLRLERARLDSIIKTLESLELDDPDGPKRRGRKFMDDGDRKAVSERMKRYWEQRRGGGSGEAQSSAAHVATAAA